MPTSPSQPSGYPRPTSFWPGATYEPAGTQASSVAVGEGPAFQLRAMGAVEHESNPLRLTAGGQSDTILVAGVGLKLDRRYGLQRFRADVEANTYKYNTQSELDYSTVNYALAWDWSFTPRFHGVVSADQRQFQEVSTDPVTFANNVGRRTEMAQGVEGIYDLGAAWRLLGGIAHTEAKSTQPASWDGSPSVTSGRVGAGYEWASGTSLYATYRKGDGTYKDPTPGAIAGDFRERETQVHLKWPVTGKTSVDARIGHLARDHEFGGPSDFSGVVGSAAVIWDVTGKTRVVGGFIRDLSASGFATGGAVQSDRFYVGPVWRATAQVAVNARYEHVERDWKDVPAGSPELGRNETSQILSAGVEWEPRRWVAVSGYARSEKQKSNLNAGYRNNTIGAAAKFYFF